MATQRPRATSSREQNRPAPARIGFENTSTPDAHTESNNGELSPTHHPDQMTASNGISNSSAGPTSDWLDRVHSSGQPVVNGGLAPVIPDIVIRRLPVYVRTLRSLSDRGIGSVSSDELAANIGVTAAQIRRDLSYFGKFGKQGKGYDTAFLAGAIADILGLNAQWDVALAGLGNLGRAIARYRGFTRSSFNIVALFDHNAAQIEAEIDGVPVLAEDRITEIMHDQGIRIGIIAVPGSDAQTVADRMVAGGVRAILNYAPVVLKVPPHVTVREIDPVSALQSMTYYLNRDLVPE